MKPSVILYKKLPDDLEQRLNALFTVTRVPNLSEETVQQHAAEFAQAAGLLGAGGKVDAALLDKMPALRVASTVSVGYDNFDVDALTARKVVLMHTPTVLTETVADTLMALVLSTARRVVEVAERVKAGEWQKSIGPDWYGTDVHHKTIGIVGMGRIGMALAQRAHAGFGMPVLYNARRHHTEAEERFGARYCELDALLEEADFVGSTTAMGRWLERERPARVALITECSMSDNVAADNPDVEFVRPCNLCPHMKRNTLTAIRRSLELGQHEITLDPALEAPARRAIERMLEVH